MSELTLVGEKKMTSLATDQRLGAHERLLLSRTHLHPYDRFLTFSLVTEVK